MSSETYLEERNVEAAGLIRRVRREADLSQTDLATLLGVSQSTIARWENGVGEPTVGVFQRILALAGFSLWIEDAQGSAAQPLRDDGPRDEAGRRLAAHLDVHEGVEPSTGRRLLRTPHRRERDRRRRRAGCVPSDHSSAAEIAARRAERLAEESARWAHVWATVRAVQRADALARGEADPCALPECACLDECLDAPRCTDACPCACER